MKYDTNDKGSTSTKKTPDVGATPDSVDSPKGDLGDRHDAFPLGIPERIYTRIRDKCLAKLREVRESGIGPTAKEKANAEGEKSAATTTRERVENKDMPQAGKVMIHEPLGMRVTWTRAEIEEVYSFRKNNPSAEFSNLFLKTMANPLLRQNFIVAT